MAKPKITLFVDSVSPFAYMALYALRNFPVFQQCDITYVPIFLGGLMKACNNTAPLNITNKDKWINLERQRWARLFSIPMADDTPDGFPPNTVNVQRALTALHMEQPDKVAPTLEALYHAFWVERQPMPKPEVAIPCFAKGMGCSESDAKALFEKGSKPDVKALLVKNTDVAFSTGAFGLPWFVATNSKGEEEGFWGFDHLGQVVEHLGLSRPSSGGWKAML